MHNIFISKPNALNKWQRKFYEILEVTRTRGLQISSLGSKQYSNKAPFLSVRQLLNECEGAIILGFKQIIVEQCIEKEGTENEDRTRNGFFLPTPWNHLEAGLAFGLNLPLLIMHEKRVEGGIFDQGVTDKFIHQIDLSVENKTDEQINLSINEYFESENFIQPFNEWHEEVILFGWDKTRKKREHNQYI